MDSNEAERRPRPKNRALLADPHGFERFHALHEGSRSRAPDEKRQSDRARRLGQPASPIAKQALQDS
jgi:hypothetical protein